MRRWLTDILEKHIKLEKYVDESSPNLFRFTTSIFRSEREKYAKHRHKSEKHPNKYLSIIIDGMDQDKTDIPHIISNPKALAGSYRLETHVTGVRAHGHCTLMLVDYGEFPHNTNLTIEALLKVFCLLKVCGNVYVHSSSVLNVICSCRTTCHLCCISKWTILAGITRTNIP